MTRKDELVDAALTHALFDGFSPAAIEAARADLGMSAAEARALLPKGAVDLALAYHRRGDEQMVELLRAEDLSQMRFRDRIAHAVRLRLKVADRELVRRGFALFALPQHAAAGSRALWETADHIWTTLGDTSRDINWYTKRASLSAVYSATALYWLGDESEDNRDTWAFLDRRIENVMQFEKVKAQAKANPLGKAFMAGPGKLFDLVRAPQHAGHGK
ncbi:MAG TPA: COQ9 family protein [Rhodobacterales bacterium]|nr:COQ9 family protein [Rhodobacterales bacterium]